MSIESEFSHRGFPVRLKYRGGVGEQAVYHLFILTDQGPYFDTAKSIFEAKSKAVGLINAWTANDWCQSVHSETSNGDDIRRIGSARRESSEEAARGTTRSA